jgi:hypothetical protein
MTTPQGPDEALLAEPPKGRVAPIEFRPDGGHDRYPPRAGGSRANLYTLARSPLEAHASTAVSVSRITSSGCETIAT